MYDPTNLSQSYDPYSYAQADAKPADAPTDPEGKASAVAGKEKKPAAPVPGGGSAQDVSLKKKWCNENVGKNFFPADGVAKSALEQFTTFVNTLCPELEAEVPSKYTALFSRK